ncbi:MAG: hypothetical protein KC413_22365, partial [Anaerolineales bacterium]|nr:hypothetical protein [Anaerolineales bacterium]
MKKLVYPFFLVLLNTMLLVSCAAPAAEEPAVAEPAVEEPVVEEPAMESVTITNMASQDWVKNAEMELAEK